MREVSHKSVRDGDAGEAIAGSALQHLLMNTAAGVHATLLNLNGYGAESGQHEPRHHEHSADLKDVSKTSSSFVYKALPNRVRNIRHGTHKPAHLWAVHKKKIQDLTRSDALTFNCVWHRAGRVMGRGWHLRSTASQPRLGFSVVGPRATPGVLC